MSGIDEKQLTALYTEKVFQADAVMKGLLRIPEGMLSLATELTLKLPESLVTKRRTIAVLAERLKPSDRTPVEKRLNAARIYTITSKHPRFRGDKDFLHLMASHLVPGLFPGILDAAVRTDGGGAAADELFRYLPDVSAGRILEKLIDVAASESSSYTEFENDTISESLNRLESRINEKNAESRRVYSQEEAAALEKVLNITSVASPEDESENFSKLVSHVAGPSGESGLREELARIRSLKDIEISEFISRMWEFAPLIPEEIWQDGSLVDLRFDLRDSLLNGMAATEKEPAFGSPWFQNDLAMVMEFYIAALRRQEDEYSQYQAARLLHDISAFLCEPLLGRASGLASHIERRGYRAHAASAIFASRARLSSSTPHYDSEHLIEDAFVESYLDTLSRSAKSGELGRLVIPVWGGAERAMKIRPEPEIAADEPVSGEEPSGGTSAGFAGYMTDEIQGRQYADTIKVESAEIKGESQAQARYINLWFSRDHTDEPRIESDRTLVRGSPVFLRVQIDRYDNRTILAEAQPFPSREDIEKEFRKLKGKPIPLEAALFSDDFEIPLEERTRKLTLDLNSRTKIIYFRVKPVTAGTSRLRLCVFYREHLLQSLMIMAAVTEKEAIESDAIRAGVEMTFSADFSHVKELKPRRIWLGINRTDSSTHNLNIKSKNTALNRSLEATRIDEAVNTARRTLKEVSFITDSGGNPVRYRFDAENRPLKDGTAMSEGEAEARFGEDLIKLAQAGCVIYQAVLGTGAAAHGEDAAETNRLVRTMESSLMGKNTETVQIVRLRAIEDIWPWAMMYDLSIDPEPGKVSEVCLHFRDGSGGSKSYHECRENCRHGKLWSFRENKVVCPFGFWGFRHIIEQPYRHYHDPKRAIADLPEKIKLGDKPVLKMPVETGLIGRTGRHEQAMKQLEFSILRNSDDTLDACQLSPKPHVLYFFCHGVYREGKEPYLVVGNNENLAPSQLGRLGMDWRETNGLVFINGCETVGLEPKSLSIIMAPFVDAGVSGVIGTEIPVHTSLAGWFGENFFSRFLPLKRTGKPAGNIIMELRLELLGRLNPLGLVYTPYCSADLEAVRY